MDTQQSFVALVREAARQANPQEAVASVLQRALRAWDGIPPWLGPPSAAELPIWYADDAVTVMHVVWPPRMLTEPHNHNMWAAIALYLGREDNILWRREGESIVACGAESVAPGSVLSLAPDAIHSVVNPLDSYTAAIHVYGGDFMNTPRSEWDTEHHAERPRDLAKSHRTFAAADRLAKTKA